MTAIASEDVKKKGVAAWTVERPVATLMVVVAVFVFGYISFQQLPVHLMPELSYPTLTVRTDVPGAAPEEIEQNVTTPIEELVRTVEGVVSVTSTSRAGQSDVVMRFGWNTDMDYATQKVRERVELVPLEDDIDRPIILRYDPALDPILRVGLSGPVSLAELRRLADEEVRRPLERIEGVAMIRVRGGLEEIIRIDLNPGRMSLLGINQQQIATRLASENINLAGGALAEGDVTYLVRTLNAFSSIEEIQQLIVALPGGVPVRLDQVAEVYQDTRDREVITRIGRDGEVFESVVIEVFKEADANLVGVANSVRNHLFGDRRTLRDRAQILAADRAEHVALHARLIVADQPMVSSPDPVSRIIEDRLPSQLSLTLLSDQSTFIQRSIDEVTSTAIWGALFAILVLFLFLRNTWTTIIIGIAIPVSVIAAFGALRLAGVTLNVMSLGGLALGIGMLVDNSIVVLESIFRCKEEGDDTVEAALRGSREVAGAVVASTLTTIAVFFPIVFVEGIAGQLFGDLALSVVFALLASLAVALFFVPMLASRRGLNAQAAVSSARENIKVMVTRPPVAREELLRDKVAYHGLLKGPRRPLFVLLLPIVIVLLLSRFIVTMALDLVSRILVLILGSLVALVAFAFTKVLIVLRFVFRYPSMAFDWLWGGIERLYAPILRLALRVRLLVALLAVGVFVFSLQAFSDLGMELIPTLHQGEFNIELAMPVGTRLEETSSVIGRLEQDLSKLEGLEAFVTTVGVERTEIQTSDEGEHTARISVRLAPSEDPISAQRALMTQARHLGGRIPGARMEVRQPTLFTMRTPLEVEVRSDNLTQLALVTDEIMDALRDLPELQDLRTNLGRGFPEVQIRFDRDRLATYGLSAREVGESVRDQVRGAQPTRFRDGGIDYDILVRTDPKEVPGVDALARLPVRPRTEEFPEIRLGQVASFHTAIGPSEIRHLEGQRAAVIEADISLISLNRAASRVEERLRLIQLPANVSASVAGQSEEIERARSNLLFALILAIFLVYIVLASKFESFRGPFIILLSVPLALVGVVGGLLFAGLDVSILVFIGMIMLVGIVVNNAIVLVDYVQQLRDRGLPMEEAIVQACQIRLRPVLITTLTTILGLLPMALGLGEGAELRQPMAVTVIAGLASATVLTLIVVPIFYRIIMATLSPAGSSSKSETGSPVES